MLYYFIHDDRHPYFWADEKKLRFVLIAGSDVLRDMKHGFVDLAQYWYSKIIDIEVFLISFDWLIILRTPIDVSEKKPNYTGDPPYTYFAITIIINF